jgi:hypothetical protein
VIFLLIRALLSTSSSSCPMPPARLVTGSVTGWTRGSYPQRRRMHGETVPCKLVVPRTCLTNPNAFPKDRYCPSPAQSLRAFPALLLLLLCVFVLTY